MLRLHIDKANPPANLKNWTTSFYDNGRVYSGNAFPVKPDESSLHKTTTNEGKEITVGYLSSITIGFYPHPELDEILQKIKLSISFSYNQ